MTLKQNLQYIVKQAVDCLLLNGFGIYQKKCFAVPVLRIAISDILFINLCRICIWIFTLKFLIMGAEIGKYIKMSRNI